jgi:O-antigen/teichoic acid export membrane protein
MIRISENKIVKNASWIIISKFIQSILGLVITMLIARYLGPKNFGVISYAASLVGFVTPLVFLGINNILVQEITKNSQKEGVIIGTSMLLSIISALFCMLGVFIFTFFANVGETETIIVSSLYSLILIFQVLDLIQYWFQAKLLSKYSSIISLIAYFIVSGYKIILLIFQKNIYWFSISNAMGFLIISISLIFLYFKLGGQRFSFSKDIGKKLFAKSKYYILPGLMIAIFAQTDKIMIKLMINASATGYFSAAVSAASMASFVYVAIIDSFRPVIFKYFDESKEKFELNIKRLYSIIIYISLAQAIVMTIFSGLIISILYGSSYTGAISALRIICWYTTFSYLGSVRNIWILCMNLQKYLLAINLSGALLNIILNLLLIPIIGIKGAAIASFVTQFFANFVMGFILVPMRDNNKLIISSLNPKYIISIFKKTEVYDRR